ncbi:hypothetical protein W97_04658 [Coniosporium apollinis CBS 100218]|uniref:Endonuclease/exonuclease/phosphatase domain-containing protein n=1 Tax=Coniosporium apollinis (strain CBS 100218) TaxID=1168221 RepID=R7YU45_CONA1|nr:uncharacterized protein W97_04658 [Coniosporium apollinis CBS 100218]EON65420.1 hypothetical protein W97_04658 [Coniosporium apollinis CBS 100218]
MKAPSQPLPIRLITHNVRYATTHPFKGEELWPIRLPRLLAELKFNTAHNPEAFICLQEALHHQLVDILQGLNAGITDAEQQWGYVGVGRDDGKQAGEYSPILFRRAVWEVLSCETIWLSQTPDVPSKGWDAGSIRILTKAVFEHRESGRKVRGANTHLDDQGSKARLEAAKMIVKEVNGDHAELPVFLAGDMNSETHQEAYRVLSAPESPLRDLNDAVGEGGRYGHENTYTSFNGEEEQKRIDFLFLGPKGKDMWDVKGYAVLESRFEDGVYSSDHRAVVGDVEVRGYG